MTRKFLAMLHPKAERQRMEMRRALAEATAAAEDISRTVSQTDAMQWGHLEKRERLAEVLQFDTFAAICEFRYAPKHSAMMRLCKHPEHEAHASNIASCNALQCPKLKGSQ